MLKCAGWLACLAAGGRADPTKYGSRKLVGSALRADRHAERKMAKLQGSFLRNDRLEAASFTYGVLSRHQARFKVADYQVALGTRWALAELRRLGKAAFSTERTPLIVRTRVQFLGISAPAVLPLVFLLTWIGIIWR
jgi:hypothetical protein